MNIQTICPICNSIFIKHRKERKTCSTLCGYKQMGKTNTLQESWHLRKDGYMAGHYWDENGERIYTRKHRYIMEKFLGRRLSSSEEINHIDGNKQNNTLSNLEILTKSAHAKLTNKEHPKRKPYNLKPMSVLERRRRSDTIKKLAIWKLSPCTKKGVPHLPFRNRRIHV